MLLSLSGSLFEDSYSSQSVTFPRFCQIARSAGYEGVELRDTQVSPSTLLKDRIRLLCIVKDLDLKVTCLTARYLPTSNFEREEFFIRYLDLCRDMECSLLKIASDTAWLRKAAEKAEEYGVALATNNHINTNLETVEGMRRYFHSIDRPNFGLLYDPLHLYVNGEDYLGCIPEFAGITRNILVHSVRRAMHGENAVLEKNGSRWAHALPDDCGVQDWPVILTRFKHLNYNGLITIIERGWSVHQREYVARCCADMIRKMWKTA